MNMNTNNIIERVKMRAKRLLDDCSENNRSLCNQKGTQNSYESLLKLVAKYEDGERSKKEWLAMQVLMETETSSMKGRFDYVDMKEAEGNDQLNKLANLLGSLGEKIEQGEYHIKDMSAALTIVDKILNSIEDMIQDVEALFPRPNKAGAAHLSALERVVKQTKFKLEKLIQMVQSPNFDSKNFGQELKTLAVVIMVEQKKIQAHEAEMSSKALGFREMHIDLDHTDVIEICQEIAQSI